MRVALEASLKMEAALYRIDLKPELTKRYLNFEDCRSDHELGQLVIFTA